MNFYVQVESRLGLQLDHQNLGNQVNELEWKSATFRSDSDKYSNARRILLVARRLASNCDDHRCKRKVCNSQQHRPMIHKLWLPAIGNPVALWVTICEKISRKKGFKRFQAIIWANLSLSIWVYQDYSNEEYKFCITHSKWKILNCEILH